MPEISLLVDNEVFKADKDVLCLHSDYFRAMFSGSYVENDKQEISIQVIDAASMKIILDYINTRSSALKEYSITTLEKLAEAAKFLLITKFIKEVEYFLLSQEIISVADPTGAINPELEQTEQRSTKYGLVPFKSMKPENISDFMRLCWYLSHPCLDALNELDVFIFGFNWILKNKAGDDAEKAFLTILACLDIKKLTLFDLMTIDTHMKQYKSSIAAKVVCYLVRLSEDNDLSEESLVSTRTECEETVYTETLNLLKESKSRCINYTPIVTVLNIFQLEFYKVTEKEFEMWQLLPGFCIFYGPKPYTGRIVVSWGLAKLVVINENTKSIWVYDAVMKEWHCHGEGLWDGCLDGAIVVGDFLYLIEYCPIESRCFTAIYDLKGHEFIKMMSLCRQKNSESQLASVCFHEGSIYMAVDFEVYKREGLGSTDRWSKVYFRNLRVDLIASFKGYIYFTTKKTLQLYRYRPTVEFPREEINPYRRVTTMNKYAIHMYSFGDRLIFLSNQCGWFIDGTLIEEHRGNADEKLKELHKVRNIEIGNVVSCCPLLLDIPMYNEMSNYVKQHLEKYEAIL